MLRTLIDNLIYRWDEYQQRRREARGLDLLARIARWVS